MRSDWGSDIETSASKITSSIFTSVLTVPLALSLIPPGLFGAVSPVVALSGLVVLEPNAVDANSSLGGWRVAVVAGKNALLFDGEIPG